MYIPDRVWRFIERWEGGDTATNDSLDTGGITKFGISQNNNPTVDVLNLTADKAKQVYYKRYWTVAYCDELPEFMRLIQMNCAVNCGTRTAIKCLQRVVRVKADGKFGNKTREAVRGYGVRPRMFTINYLSYQCLYYCNIVERRKSQHKWLRGWVKRTYDACWETAINFGAKK